MTSPRVRPPARRAPVKPVAYAPPGDYPYGIELLSSDELARRVVRNDARGVERPSFPCLLYVTSGRYRHMVDFEHFECGAGATLLLRPGQVHRFGNLDGWTGWMVVFRPEELPTTESDTSSARARASFDRLADRSALISLPASARVAVTSTLAQMAEDARRTTSPSLVGALLRRELEALLLRLELAQPEQSAGQAVGPDAFERVRRFETLMETELRRWHGVGRYAKRLHCSDKTLSRSALAVRGKTAKALLTDRIALEAKRLLVHSTASVAAIAEALGFEEPTNFVKFFKRETRVTPGAFRRQHARTA